MGKKSNNMPKKKGKRALTPSQEYKRKGPAGTGKARKRLKRMKVTANKDTHEQLAVLQQKRAVRHVHEKHQGTGNRGPKDAPVSVPFESFFWKDAAPEGEPDDALKLQRKELGIKVRGAAIPPPVSNFNDPRLPPSFASWYSFIQGGRVQKITKPTPIQAQVLPAALCGVDVIGIAPTGSGKTLAYILPAVPHILGQRQDKHAAHVSSPVCLVLAPTRELAKQVCDATGGGATSGWLKRLFSLRAGAVYGGIEKDIQLDAIVTMGVPQILCATPGRLLDLLSMNVFSLEKVTYLVLDEADRMLALGFEPQLTSIMAQIRPNRQVCLFSATFALKLQNAAEEWMSKERVVIRVATMQMDHQGDAEEADDEISAKPGNNEDDPLNPKKDSMRAEREDAQGLSSLTVSDSIEQTVHVCSEHKKQKKLMTYLTKMREKDKASGMRQRSAVLIFCKEIKKLVEVAKFLSKNGEKCAALHSGIPQAKREQALADLKVGRIDTLVATDVASRGLHIGRLRYVVNYDFPTNLASYCHRIGRAGRQGVDGWAFSFFTRNLAPMASGLVALLERCKQWVDPNLKALAEGRGNAEASDGEDDDENGGQDEAPASSSVRSAAATPRLSVGAVVSIHGMQLSPQLNGCKGTLKRHLKKSGRWEVVLESTDEVRALRAGNLEPVSVPTESPLEEGSEDDDSDGDASESLPPPVATPRGGGLRIQPQRRGFAALASSSSSEEQDDADEAQSGGDAKKSRR